MKLFLDIETGGLDPKKNPILVIGLVLTGNDGKIKRQRAYKVMPMYDKKIDHQALEVNKIDIAKHMKVASHPSDVKIMIKQFLEDAGIKEPMIIGHNAAFDISFLKEFYGKDPYPFQRHYQDTMILACTLRDMGYMSINNLKLETLAKHFGYEGEFHNALEDARATAHIYFKLMEMIRFERR